MLKLRAFRLGPAMLQLVGLVLVWGLLGPSGLRLALQMAPFIFNFCSAFAKKFVAQGGAARSCLICVQPLPKKFVAQGGAERSGL